MKILYLITKSNWGGAQRHVYDLSVEAKKRGFTTKVALGGEGILKQRLMEANIPTVAIQTLGRDITVKDDTAAFANLWKIIRDEKPDILHLHSAKAAGLGSFIGRISGIKKIIYTVHGFAWNEDRSFVQKCAIIFFTWLTMLFSTDIITLSKREMQQAMALPFMKKKVKLIPLGITPPTFYGHDNAVVFFERLIGTPLSKRTIIGTIAELHPNKGLVYLIEAARELVKTHPTLAIIIIGNGDLFAPLTKLIQEYGLGMNVYLVGFVDQASQYLKAFNIFVLPSIKEGLPYVLFEAGYAQVPIITTNVGGIPEIIDDMESGIIIQSKKAREIEHGLIFMLEHKKNCKEYAEHLRKKVEIEFSLQKMLERTFEVYS